MEGKKVLRIDLDAWLDFKSYYQSRPKKERRAIRKLIKENWRNLSGYDWKLIRQFRAEYKERAQLKRLCFLF